MSYWGSRDAPVGNFDGYDPTPYSGGYDLSLTYGRPLQPSDEICYPVSATGKVDLERPHYSSDSQTSVFETQKGDCYGLLRPGLLLHPQPPYNTGYPGYGSGFGGRPQFQDHGSAYGQRPQPQEFRSEYGSAGYGRVEPKHYGEESGYRRSEEEGYGRQGYAEEGEVGGYRRNNDHAYGGNTSYMRPSYGVGVGVGVAEEGSGGYNKSGYADDYQNTGYRKPNYYGGEEGEGYGHFKYGNDSDDVEKKHSHQKHHHRHH